MLTANEPRLIVAIGRLTGDLFSIVWASDDPLLVSQVLGVLLPQNDTLACLARQIREAQQEGNEDEE